MAKLVNKLGGVDRAARQLGISSSLLMRFVEGTSPVPDTLLLKAVDSVLDENRSVAILPTPADLAKKPPAS